MLWRNGHTRGERKMVLSSEFKESESSESDLELDVTDSDVPMDETSMKADENQTT